MFYTAEIPIKTMEFPLVVVKEQFVFVLALPIFHFVAAVSCRVPTFHPFFEEVSETEWHSGLFVAHESPKEVHLRVFHVIFD